MSSEFRRRQVVVWSWSLAPASPASGADEALLSDEERVRHRSFARPDLRDRFLVAHAGLRRVLAQHVGADPGALVFETNAHGKPRLAGQGPVHFSLSHSGDRAVLAVSDAEVGADVERLRCFDHLALARRYFHPTEVAALLDLEGEAQRWAFFLTWTLKESVVKALGLGLSVPLDSFAVAIGAPGPRLVLAPDGASPLWSLQGAVDGDYCVGLAVPDAAGVELTQRALDG